MASALQCARHFILNRKPCWKQLPWRRLFHNNDPDGKTTITVLNKQLEYGLMIDSYSEIGFRLNNGFSIIGPIAIFPRSVLSWNVADHKEINENSLSLFYLLEPRIDILVLGVGDKGIRLDPAISAFFQSKKINLEILSTDHACTTFNFLNAEYRNVAGALLPPSVIKMSPDDVFSTRVREKRAFEVDWN